MLASILSGCGTPLPADAPFALEECGLPANTRLAFAGWIEYQLLGLTADGPFSREEVVYAAVTADRVRLRPMVGPATQGRAACIWSARALETRTVPDHWPLVPTE